MVELGCQDTDWVGENDKEVLDGILPRDGLILFWGHFREFFKSFLEYEAIPG